jgi:hypothetical protein
MGRAADGTELILRTRGRIRLAPSVTTDIERFASLTSRYDPGRVIEAMLLIRGSVLAGLHRADWAVFDGTQAAMERLIAGTALCASDTLIQTGSPSEAEWVVRRALVVSPYDERLYRALLRATAAQGNRVALRATMIELLTLAGEMPREGTSYVRPGNTQPLTCLHPDTAALYQDLLRGAPAVGGTPARL